jgi:DNA repair exonuclease SbcCD nuclease subunit
MFHYGIIEGNNKRVRLFIMKFIHTADIHLGVIPDTDRKWSAERSAEIETTFDKLLDVAEERQVDLLLIAGDLFHVPPTEEHLKQLDEMLKKLSKTRTIIIAGNHDYIAKGSPADNYEFSSNTVMMPPDTFSNAYMEDINTCVTGFSFGQEVYTGDIYKDIKPQVHGAVNILLAHGGDEQHVPVNYRRLANAGFDYCALGHIHKPRHIVKNKMAYSGSLEPIEASETGRRGFVYGEYTNGEMYIKWEPFNCRSYINLGPEVKTEYTEAVMTGLLTRQIEKLGAGNIYNIILTGNMSGKEKPEFDILKQKYNIYDVVDNTIDVYDMDKLLLDNRNNILGEYIGKMSDDNSLNKKALKYGVEAILATGDKK